MIEKVNSLLNLKVFCFCILLVVRHFHVSCVCVLHLFFFGGAFFFFFVCCLYGGGWGSKIGKDSQLIFE